MQPSHPNHPCEPFTRVQKLKRKVPISMSTDMSEMVRMSIDYSLKKDGNRAKLYFGARDCTSASYSSAQDGCRRNRLLLSVRPRCLSLRDRGY